MRINFKKHVENICRVAKFELPALQRIRTYLNTGKAKSLANAFIISQFYYAYMFSTKTLISKVQKIHHCRLYLKHMRNHLKIYLLNDISIHQKHLKILATEIFKSVHNLDPQFMLNYFSFKPIP